VWQVWHGKEGLKITRVNSPYSSHKRGSVPHFAQLGEERRLFIWPWSEKENATFIIQGGPKVRRQTATTHGGVLGESFEVGKPCPETHRYAPVSTFLERLNVRLAVSRSSGQRARSEMRFSFASFGLHGVCLRSSMVPYWPEEARRSSGRGFKSVITSRVFFIFLFPFW